MTDLNPRGSGEQHIFDSSPVCDFAFGVGQPPFQVWPVGVGQAIGGKA